MNKDRMLQRVSEDFVKKGASRMKEVDVKKALDGAEEIRKKFESNGPLKHLMEDFRLLLSVLSDYWHGRYRQVPWWAISAIAFALLYVLNPFDLIPDPIPLIGEIDDAAVVGLALMLIEHELHRHQEWKLRNG
jgi:uncharacterized membrane protein YkvA (DUF1232 family)